MAESAGPSDRDLALWGLLDVVRREQMRDKLIASVTMPPSEVFDVLMRQWAREKGLDSIEAVKAWLEHQGLASEDLISVVARSWRWNQWCQREGAARLNSYFLARKTSLDQVKFWRLLCPDQDLSNELFQQLRGDEVTLERLEADASRGLFSVEQLGPVSLSRLDPPLAELLRVSAIGEIWSPRPAEHGGWQIVVLLQRKLAVLDQSLRSQLLEELGESLLDSALAKGGTEFS